MKLKLFKKDLSTPRRAVGLGAMKYRLLAFFAVFGPGFITANVDNDPGGILTYSQAGAKLGYALLWTLIPTTIALIVVQEMAARMGAVTGKGLADLIREEFGLRATFFVMVVLGVADFGNIMSEFAGLASGMGIFGVSKYIVVPLGAALVWLVVVRGSYKPVERILILFSLIYFTYPVSALLGHPDWHQALKDTFVPQISSRTDYLLLVVGLVGTTITPWMQFYLQASIVEKGVTAREYRASRLDVVLGCVFTDVVAWFIIVACAATLYRAGYTNIENAADAARALKPLAGRYAALLFGAGLFNASIFAASILPLSTAYTVCEGLGFESGLDKKFREAPAFYWLYTVLVGAGAAAVLFIPDKLLIKVTVLSQVLNGVLLPPVLIYMLLLINKTSLMGKYVNGRIFNVIAWLTTAIVIAMTVTYAFVGQ
jgi:NRAMP (natural resistance-associated macrophage protein)-like metal ion transporter